MPFMIETWDKPGHQAVRQQARAAHLRYLEQMAPLLIACGAKLHDDGTDAGGGNYIVDLDSRAEAEALVGADPFTAVDLFERGEIRRWRKAYVDGSCRL